MRPLQRIILAVLVLALCGCNLPRPADLPTVTVDEAAVYTQAAETIAADYTQQAASPAPGTRLPPPKGATPSPTQPIATLPPAHTARPAYSPAAPTAVIQLPTPTSPAPTALAGDCLRMDYIADVTAPPDTPFVTGSSFIKTWRVRNSGTCAWDSTFALALVGGELTGPAATVFLPFAVPSGATVDLSVSLVVPLNPGIYASSWMLRTPQGQMFGYGASGGPLPVRIRAFQPTAAHQFPFDFSALVCTAAWRSASGALPCPGDVNSADGAVLFLDTPSLETTVSRDYGLLTHPNRDRQGWITGEFPAYLVQPGDAFVSQLSCQAGSQRCNVRMQLQYRDAFTGVASVLGDWVEVYDNGSTPVSVDLSPLAGHSVSFILAAYNQGDPKWADAIWVLPRIQRASPITQYAINWTRQNYSGRGACDGLRVSLTGSASGVAIAYDCSRGNLEIGRAALSFDQAAQVWYWVQRLSNFEGETYATVSSRAVTSWIDFHGAGLGDATTNDIQSISAFAAGLFNQIAR